jgi:hypothetical protein
MGEKVKSTNMIPDNTFIFKQYGASRNFDDHAVRLRQLLQQDAMPMLESSGHLLADCPVCKHPWYKVGRQEYPRLTSQQLALLGATLHIDITLTLFTFGSPHDHHTAKGIGQNLRNASLNNGRSILPS